MTMIFFILYSMHTEMKLLRLIVHRRKLTRRLNVSWFHPCISCCFSTFPLFRWNDADANDFIHFTLQVWLLWNENYDGYGKVKKLWIKTSAQLCIRTELSRIGPHKTTSWREINMQMTIFHVFYIFSIQSFSFHLFFNLSVLLASYRY